MTTRVVIEAEPRGRAFQRMLARDMIRLQDPASRHWLHLSGSGTTPNINQSWLGHRFQAKNLRARAEAEGRAWPFRPIHRDDAEPTTLDRSGVQ